MCMRVLYNKKPPPSRSGGQFRKWFSTYLLTSSQSTEPKMSEAAVPDVAHNESS